MAPPKPSLAVDLARQAAAAAKAEVQAEMNGQDAQASPPSFARWQPANLPLGFQLDAALAQAVAQVAGHLGRHLRHEGLEVAALVAATAHSLPTKEASPTLPAPAAARVQVREQGGGRLVRGYSESAVLGLFASQQQRMGVVVDGQV